MSMRVFKTKDYYYLSWCYYTWTLKKTKKECRDAIKENYYYFNQYSHSPAVDTPRRIANTYDKLKQFLDIYLTEDRKVEIYTCNDYTENTYSAKCIVRVRSNTNNLIASTDNYCDYDVRKNICLEFFDDIQPLDENYDKLYPIEHKEIFWKKEWFKLKDWKVETTEEIAATEWGVLEEWEELPF